MELEPGAADLFIQLQRRKLFMKERDTQRLILDWLAANHILAFRLNVGAMKVDNRFVQFRSKGHGRYTRLPDETHRIRRP